MTIQTTSLGRYLGTKCTPTLSLGRLDVNKNHVYTNIKSSSFELHEALIASQLPVHIPEFLQVPVQERGNFPYVMKKI